MPHTTCAHCNVAIADHSTMVEQDGKTYCCKNCAATTTASTMNQHHQAALGACAHCHVPIVDPSTRVERDGATFCCGNCAEAMPAGAGHQH